MKFRCPNCSHPIRVGEEDDFALREPLDAIECPSCHSRFSLSEDMDSTVAMPEGQMVAHFRILSLLGEGAFGTVYKAFDEELKRIVAIKVPRQGRVTKDTSRTFLREAQAAAAVHHPNAVSVYEVGVHEDQYYIATQYIDGISLSDYLKSHSLSTEDCVRLMIKLLRGLQVFHEKHLVHRDLKPGNILLDSQNEPHIADFGLARSFEPTELTVTHSGQIVGTLHYMSPEQARGEQRSIDNHSDLYSMGVILYQLLTGTRPFQATSQQTLLFAILHDDPPSPRKVNPKIPRDLETICLKAMEKDVHRRYSSASDMAHSLELFLQGKPIPDKPVSRTEKVVKWIKRNRALSAATGVALTAVIAALIAILIPAEQPPTDSVPVILATDPPATEILFERYDDALRVPHSSEFRQTTADSQPVFLLPGLYKVRASANDGRFHEVWRTVPQPTDERPADSRFPHLYYSWNDRKQAVLPPFHLFRDDEIPTAMVRIPGGEFVMGYQVTGDIAGRHKHPVSGFLVARDEVTYGDFRKVMSQPIPWADDSRTWLQSFESQYGDRSPIADGRPVTGYPIDVAILFCELTGCRLPTHVEYEFLATQRGQADFPTGESAAVSSIEVWEILDVADPTQDVSPEGVRNLYFSVAEYTDSVAMAYMALYPALFEDPQVASFPPDLRDLSMRMKEIRGAPTGWALQLPAQSSEFNVRERSSLLLLPQADMDAETSLGRIGWRSYRSAIK
ncbi:MAG: bifunctional serine/threonine-protein kinase/formylglycine-generating enzyme family protein [Planctomycetaceae bacterium]